MAATRYAETIKNDTKNFITTAMMQLLLKENWSTLTVSQVCKRAGVSRMAFYRNFDGLEQVLYEYFQSKIAAIFETIQENSPYSVKYNSQLLFFDTFGDFLLLSSEHGFEPIIQRVFTEEIEKLYAADNDEYWTVFMSSGVYAIWRKWLFDGRKRPLEEIMELLKKLNTTKELFRI